MTEISKAADQYSDQLWRLHNLYWIIDKQSKRILFKPNPSQLNLYHKMWYRNLILKARQRGYTTFIDIYALDCCLFNNDFSAGIITHNLEDSKKIFRTKVKFPYENLPDGIKSIISAKNDRSGEYIFSNGSSISVSTSFRSGTLQLLHVSELGKIAAKSPEKSREIRTGAFESVPTDGIIFVESTAEGNSGDFYLIAKKAQANNIEGVTLNNLEMKFFFDAWWQNPDYVLDSEVIIDLEHVKYFWILSDSHGIKLTDQQKWWYIAKHETQQDDMKKEYPSYPDEAFEAAIIGGIYTNQMAKMRKDGRICNIPVESGVEVDTFWDLGKGDNTSIWFMQRIGKEIRWVDYYQASGEDIEHYCRIIKGKDYLYGSHYMPHDVDIELLGMTKTRKQQFEEGGVRPIIKVPRIPKLIDGIQMVRKTFSTYWMDKERCSQGIKNLDSYQWKWNQSTATWSNEHLHNWASDGADALRQHAQAYNSYKKERHTPLNFKSEF